MADFGISETALLYGALAAAAVGGGVSAYGQYQAGQNAQAAGKYNARLAENQALQAQYAGQAAAQAQRDRTRRVLGLQRSLTAGSGVEEAGSPLLTMMDTATQGELEAQKAQYTGQVQADNEMAKAAYSRWQGRTAASNANVGVGATLLQTGSNIAGAYWSSGASRRRGLGYGTIDPRDAGPGMPW